jgi:hypothetical protein
MEKMEQYAEGLPTFPLKGVYNRSFINILLCLI